MAKREADLVTAQNKQRKESEFYNNLGKILSMQQSQNNANANMEKKFMTGISVQEAQNKRDTAQSIYDSAKTELYWANKSKNATRIKEANNALTTAQTNLQKLDSFDKDDLMNEYRNRDQISLIKKRKFE
jgi:hypothetical protein